ncbi:N-acetylgalactosamine kinase [Fopius arisanus]|nr:PREDICTED: N-acetylgalactosamine kinase [Fopius arisanus]XP_011313986.1 PREDICTED: N-acetylgalactosamine kinase [Fopius arisanus]
MDKVPIVPADDAAKSRLKKLAWHFECHHKAKPEFFIRVPGRVNLIGEHIDYSGYAVCPMAIEQNILVAIGQSKDDRISITNIDPKYEEIDMDLSISSFREVLMRHEIKWYKYFVCGLTEGFELAKSGLELIRGLNTSIWGTIPPAAGLSSSSALVCSGVLAITHANKLHLAKDILATQSAKAERLIGTEGGGMDHAIAFLAQQGTAKLIEFNPLRATDVTLPRDAVFVIADSMKRHNKAAFNNYNTRVVECKLAAKIIAKKYGICWRDIEILIDVQRVLGKTLKEMADIAAQELSDCDVQEICQILQVSVMELSAIVKIDNDDTRKFHLRKRAQHVFEEAARVIEFRDVCCQESTNQIQRLGELMIASHRSLRYLFDCSIDEVNQLVDMAIDSGAAGARLTGAGWGGCVIALTTKDKADEFVKDLGDKMREAYHLSDETDMDTLIFKTEPGQGAAVYSKFPL